MGKKNPSFHEITRKKNTVFLTNRRRKIVIGIKIFKNKFFHVCTRKGKYRCWVFFGLPSLLSVQSCFVHANEYYNGTRSIVEYIFSSGTNSFRANWLSDDSLVRNVYDETQTSYRAYAIYMAFATEQRNPWVRKMMWMWRCWWLVVIGGLSVVRMNREWGFGGFDNVGVGLSEIFIYFLMRLYSENFFNLINVYARSQTLLSIGGSFHVNLSLGVSPSSLRFVSDIAELMSDLTTHAYTRSCRYAISMSRHRYVRWYWNVHDDEKYIIPDHDDIHASTHMTTPVSDLVECYARICHCNSEASWWYLCQNSWSFLYLWSLQVLYRIMSMLSDLSISPYQIMVIIGDCSRPVLWNRNKNVKSIHGRTRMPTYVSDLIRYQHDFK